MVRFYPTNPLCCCLFGVTITADCLQIFWRISPAVRFGHNVVNNRCSGRNPTPQTRLAEMAVTVKNLDPQLVPVTTIPTLMPGQPSLVALPSIVLMGITQTALVRGQSATCTARTRRSWRHNFLILDSARWYRPCCRLKSSCDQDAITTGRS